MKAKKGSREDCEGSEGREVAKGCAFSTGSVVVLSKMLAALASLRSKVLEILSIETQGSPL